MKINTRFFIIAVLVCHLSCCCAAGSVAEGSALVGDIPVSMPLVSSPSTLNIIMTGYEGVDPADVYVWQKYAEMTGVDVNWTVTNREKRAELILSALTNRKNIDLILRCKVSTNRLTQYGESGLILDLAKDDLLKTYAPNCWAYLHSHPDTLASVMNPDGAIYALPQVNSGAELRVGIKLFVNKLWLQRVGGKLPTTTEEFRQLPQAFRDQDANGNGDPSDEIPLCCTNWQSAQQALYGAFGLASRGFHNLTVDSDPATGDVRLIVASTAYRDLLAYMNELYTDNLLDNYIFTITTDQWAANIASDTVGVFASTNLAWVPADKADQWVAIEEALEGPNGDKLWTAIRANFHSTGAAVLPATCRDPELCLRWLDYFWADEGTLFYHMGTEGETYVAQPDGTYDYLPRIYDEMIAENRSFDDVVATYSPYPGGSNPTVEIAPYFMGGEMAEVPARAARALFQYGPEEYWPSFTFTAAENDVVEVLRKDIEKYSDSMCIKFITGAKPLSEWEVYTAQLKQLKTDELLAIYQTAVDRYRALNTVLD